ncbi:assimilatory sulfite reductase (NADPH) flavoprotein subunit [Candidatus Enterovibrio escicola]|uniref:Sulfite reductase [NADPH] flavoprotein alpha-component n=1 Tax=Candidatus Enterovibrio escicola TaxID=1927127 RepID=A0A2A5T3M4_9GAMM|nr:assimilatory sulfite reductase (NADPH) flavoprotein subunit [Candidatus Enterovibrio escacola]PCS22756.1 Sulfite reductase [NADPH] flavoprotein alpha-component [Candidatus Enterovibrio escacola]
MLLTELSVQDNPLDDQQIDQLRELTSELTPQQMAWISGYFLGLSQTSATAIRKPQLPIPEISTKKKPVGKLTIIYASQTGNAKGVAQMLEVQAKVNGIEVMLYSADDYKLRDLAMETHLVLIASTNGKGEPPDNAILLHEFFESGKIPNLDDLQYAVMGLGDSSYDFFCQTGKDFDAFFSKLGAKAILPRVDCDVDYDADAKSWSVSVLAKIKESLNSDPIVVPLYGAKSIETVSTYTKQNPYATKVVINQKITGRDSSKDVRHIEIDLSDSGLTYQPGDALGVYYLNSTELVNEILAKVSLAGDEVVDIGSESLSLRQALTEKFEITSANPQQVAMYAELSGSKRLQKKANNKNELLHYANNTQIVDVLGEKKTNLSAQQLVRLLRKLMPRLYSIASSQEHVGKEVHLTVTLVEFQYGNNTRYGGASSFLAYRAEESGTVKVFVEYNKHFKLPVDDNIPLIMIGSGSGIAPFRAFMQERDVRGADGKNWLIFGDRTFSQDFLYQVEWQKFLKQGLLTKIDLAFSRDQIDKVYVQHRIIEQAKTIWQWMQGGAYLYVCGDATHMAKDVHEVLLQVVEQQGGTNRKGAESYLNEMRKTKRYQKDVY